MDYILNHIINTMKMLYNEWKKFDTIKSFDSAIAEKGLSVSKRVCQQAEEVAMTPWMKNLMICMGDIKQYQDSEGNVHTERFLTGGKSKAVAWVNKYVKACLLKFNGPEETSYPLDLPIDSPRLYDIDCWNGWKPEVWDIQPGQSEEVKEMFHKYGSPKTNLSMWELIELIKQDRYLQEAILMEFELWPRVTARRQVVAISDPFKNKGTGVSYPYFQNDRTLVPGTNTTYAQYCIDIVQKCFASKGPKGLYELARNNNVYTGYMRQQRGKGRPLIAESRIVNLIINMVNSQEMEEYKKNALGTAFLDEQGISDNLRKLAEWLTKNSDYYACNKDYTKWDYNLGAGWILLENAMRYLKAGDEFTRQLIIIRCCCNLSGLLVDGPNNKVHMIYGRQFSGYDDTTLGNTGANRVISRYAASYGDPDYRKRVFEPLLSLGLLVVGDDVLGVTKPENIGKWSENTKKTGTVAHEGDKDATGIMLIQYRGITLPKIGWIIAYNWPRVLRSMLSKENPKQLGRGGWTFSAYQQLGKLIAYPQMLKIVLNLVAACDQYHMSLNTPIQELIDMTIEEDRKRDISVKGKKNRMNSTAEKLFNNNPTLPGVRLGENGEIGIDSNYFAKVQKVLRDNYDPNWLPSLGFKNPDLSKILDNSH